MSAQPSTRLDGGGGLLGRLVHVRLGVLGSHSRLVAQLQRSCQLGASLLACRLRRLGAARRLGAIALLGRQCALRLLARRLKLLHARAAE